MERFDEGTNLRKYRILVDLFILADSNSIPALHDKVIDTLIDAWDRQGYTSISLIPHVFENTAAGSRLRDLFVDRAVAFAPFKDSFEGSLDENCTPADYLFLVCRRFAQCVYKGRPMSQKFQANRHLYHL